MPSVKKVSVALQAGTKRSLKQPRVSSSKDSKIPSFDSGDRIEPVLDRRRIAEQNLTVRDLRSLFLR